TYCYSFTTVYFFFLCSGDHPDLHSFPTRRSSDLVRWGYADEFIRLFKKNHYPVLKRQMELGHIQTITAEAPRFHGTEDGRWDYRVTLVWKNAAAPHEPFPEAELKRLFPDQETFRREEQHRFEILAAHWDLPVVTVDLTRP